MPLNFKILFKTARKGIIKIILYIISIDYVNNINGVYSSNTKHLREIKFEYQIFMVQNYNGI